MREPQQPTTVGSLSLCPCAYNVACAHASTDSSAVNARDVSLCNASMSWQVANCRLKDNDLCRFSVWVVSPTCSSSRRSGPSVSQLRASIAIGRWRSISDERLHLRAQPACALAFRARAAERYCPNRRTTRSNAARVNPNHLIADPRSTRS